MGQLACYLGISGIEGIETLAKEAGREYGSEKWIPPASGRTGTYGKTLRSFYVLINKKFALVQRHGCDGTKKRWAGKKVWSEVRGDWIYPRLKAINPTSVDRGGWMKWGDVINLVVKEVANTKWWKWDMLPGFQEHCVEPKPGEVHPPAQRDTSGWQRAVVEWVILHEHLRNLKESA